MKTKQVAEPRENARPRGRKGLRTPGGRGRILWAVSSVGKGHVIRDIAIVKQLEALANVEVDWLAPDPVGDFLRDRGYNVLPCSARLAGSGKTYEKVFAGCEEEFNLINYLKAETRLHKHDFMVSVSAMEAKAYDVIVGDEAFWLLTGFAAHWAKKPAPFVFLNDFVTINATRRRFGDLLLAWIANFKLTYGIALSGAGAPDLHIYLGYVGEIPDERPGFLLPNKRKWAQQHYRFVKPVVSFDPTALPAKPALRKKLGLPQEVRVLLATLGLEGRCNRRVGIVEDVFENLRTKFPDAYFVMVCPERGNKDWIHYYRFLEGLYEYYAAADFVITQSGYGKISELSAVGTPFIAVPLDYHFEQEYVMRHRLEHHGVGKSVTLRDHPPRNHSNGASVNEESRAEDQSRQRCGGCQDDPGRRGRSPHLWHLPLTGIHPSDRKTVSF